MNGAKQSPWIKQLMCNYHSLPAIPFFCRGPSAKEPKEGNHSGIWIGLEWIAVRRERVVKTPTGGAGVADFWPRRADKRSSLATSRAIHHHHHHQSPRGRSWTEEAITILGVLSSWKPNHVIWPDKWGGICTQRNCNGCFLNIEASLMDILYIWFFSHKGLKGSHHFSQCPTRCAHR